MRNQRRTKAPYTRESIERALVHHTIRGAVRLSSPPGSGRSTWRIQLNGLAPEEFTTPQAYALCLGLAAGERAYRTDTQ